MIEDLINTWKEGKGIVVSAAPPEEIIINAHAKKRAVLYAHLGTILVLTISFFGLASFFYAKGGFAESLSRLGMWLMMGALVIRIVIESISIVKSNAIHLSESTDKATGKAHSLYAFRKKVHGPLSMGIVGLYVVGFYALTPEFSTYVSLTWMIAIHISFLTGAAFLIWVARRGIRKEMQSLSFLTNLRQEMRRDENATLNNLI